MKRYALYFAPDRDSAWWQAGCVWLGRDPETGRILQQPSIDGLHADLQHELTRDARRYGFHATLKAPFRLHADFTVDALGQALDDFCSRQNELLIPSVQIEWMGSFLALRPNGDQGAINDFAFTCVRQFDQFRAPLNQAELARRKPDSLNPNQLALLERWGYPYTGEEFRFHMTVTDQLHAAHIASQLHAAATEYFQLSAPLILNNVSLFVENQPGADFQLLERFSFA